eukprot:gene6886-30861_t
MSPVSHVLWILWAGDLCLVGRYGATPQGKESPAMEIIEQHKTATHPYEVFALRAMLAVPYFEKALYEAAISSAPDKPASKVPYTFWQLETSLRIILLGSYLSQMLSVHVHGLFWQMKLLATMSVHHTRAYFNAKYGGHLVDNPKGEVGSFTKHPTMLLWGFFYFNAKYAGHLVDNPKYAGHLVGDPKQGCAVRFVYGLRTVSSLSSDGTTDLSRQVGNGCQAGLCCTVCARYQVCPQTEPLTCHASEMFLDMVKDLTGKPLTADAWVKELKQPLKELEEHKAYDDAVLAGPKFPSGTDVDLGMRIILAHGDEVIADTEKEGLSKACSTFKDWVQKNYFSS